LQVVRHSDSKTERRNVDQIGEHLEPGMEPDDESEGSQTDGNRTRREKDHESERGENSVGGESLLHGRLRTGEDRSKARVRV
jgi:hypothetical protein